MRSVGGNFRDQKKKNKRVKIHHGGLLENGGVLRQRDSCPLSDDRRRKTGLKGDIRSLNMRGESP